MGHQSCVQLLNRFYVAVHMVHGGLLERLCRGDVVAHVAILEVAVQGFVVFFEDFSEAGVVELYERSQLAKRHV